ncbi:MAG: helix-turn-helix domain-containing protein [Chloroflexi bacterium]|nr:helix-turn-helix domain-containing protein [Chloroflexota bacterium]
MEYLAVDQAYLAKTLRDLREFHRLSALELSRLTGVQHHTLLRLEKAEIPKPGIDDLAALARFYGLDLNHVGALAGVWVAEDDNGLSLPLREAIVEARQAATPLSPLEQADVADAILLALLLDTRRRRRHREAEQPAVESDAAPLARPAWLQRHLAHPSLALRDGSHSGGRREGDGPLPL